MVYQYMQCTFKRKIVFSAFYAWQKIKYKMKMIPIMNKITSKANKTSINNTTLITN